MSVTVSVIVGTGLAWTIDICMQELCLKVVTVVDGTWKVIKTVEHDVVCSVSAAFCYSDVLHLACKILRCLEFQRIRSLICETAIKTRDYNIEKWVQVK